MKKVLMIWISSLQMLQLKNLLWSTESIYSQFPPLRHFFTNLSFKPTYDFYDIFIHFPPFRPFPLPHTPHSLCGAAKNSIDSFTILRKILTMMSSLWRCRHYRDTGENIKNFKCCSISLNMLHTCGLCEVLKFTLNSALCAPIAQDAIKQLLLGAS